MRSTNKPIRYKKGATETHKDFKITRLPQPVYKLHPEDGCSGVGTKCSAELHGKERYVLEMSFNELRNIQEAYKNHIEKYNNLYTKGCMDEKILLAMWKVMRLTI